jgi:hypothetical protein
MMLNCFSLIASHNYTATDNGYILMDNTNNIPQVITCIQNSEFTGTSEEIAQQYITANSYFLFNNINAEIEMIEYSNDPSGTHVRFHQEVNNIPVISSGIVISLNNQKEITMITNHYKPGISVSTTPLVNLNEAIQIARNSFENSEFETIIPIKSQLSVYVDENYTSYLVWKLNIVPIDGGDWYILINALNGDIVKKENIAAGNNGRVFDPDPGTYFEDITLPDSNDEDYPELFDAYQLRVLNGLNPPVNDLYYLRGEYVYSDNYFEPNLVTTEPTPNFLYNRSQNGFEETNCYYHLDKGYSDENIFILFAGGEDFQPFWIAGRYTVPGTEPMTDYPADIASVNNVFTGLANGTGGFPQLQEDDFLFCCTFEQIKLSNLNCKVKVFDANTTTKKTILAFLESM